MKDKNNMTREEAMEAVRNGYYICHPMMKDRDYVQKCEYSQYNELVDERGHKEQFNEFFALRAGGPWETGWYLH
jgi:hypothetical protein